MTAYTFSNFTRDADKRYHEGDERIGQSYFNHLATVRDDLSEQIRGNFELDPFYKDSNFHSFLNFIHENWEQTQ